MTHQIAFDSAARPEGELLTLAAGYVSLNAIDFVQEQITVQIESKTGDVVFFDSSARPLLSVKVPVPTDGDEKLSHVNCAVSGEVIRLGFPEYDYEDTYPHCDGESDRWKKVIAGYRYLCYDCKNNCIVE